MGEVYRAYDEQLGRNVALKLLPSDQLGDAAARARLLREARSAAALNHPHICTIYEVSEAGDQAYIAMELIEGTTLSARIESGSLTEAQIVQYAIQLADALSHAHDRGIVHHDLKSSNVMITGDDRLKVLDFGLAKKVGEGAETDAATEARLMTLTRPGAVIGTLAYMAPEQLRGNRGDVRSDIWAFGVILCEMITRERPFQGQTHNDLVAAILNEPPRFRAKVRQHLRSLIERCLAKDPERRYRRASEIRAVLESPALFSRLSARQWVGAAAIAVAIAVAVTVPLWKDRVAIGGKPRVQSLAVLPLENLSGDASEEYFADGMTEALITDLGKTRGVSRVIARSSVMRYKGSKTPPADIARQLNVDALMTGTVVRSGGRVRVTAALVDPSTGEELWAGNYERDLRDILALQTELTRAIMTEIKGALTPTESRTLASARPVDPAAYEDYLKGQFYWHRFTLQDFETARFYFERALQKDPNYAPAYLGLSDAIGTPAHMGLLPTTEIFPRAKALVVRALALDPTLGEAHEYAARFMFAWDWDWAGAEREFKRAIELNPNDPDAHCIYSQLLQSTNRLDESIAEARRAVDIDPQNGFFKWNLALPIAATGRYDDAIAIYRKMFASDPNSYMAQDGIWDVLFLKGDRDEALKQAKARFASLGRADIAAAMQGQYGEAMRRGADALIAARPRTYVGAVTIARMYAHAGMSDRVFEWLNKAAEERDTGMCYVVGDPLYASIRRDPRFAQILATVRSNAASSSR